MADTESDLVEAQYYLGYLRLRLLAINEAINTHVDGNSKNRNRKPAVLRKWNKSLKRRSIRAVKRAITAYHICTWRTTYPLGRLLQLWFETQFPLNPAEESLERCKEMRSVCLDEIATTLFRRNSIKNRLERLKYDAAFLAGPWC